jgi:uncharacterized membrane protein YhaH (DUF805 family)
MGFLADLRLVPWLLFSFRGRISSHEFRVGFILDIFLCLFVFALLRPLLATALHHSPALMPARRIAAELLMLFAAYVLSALYVKRSHDLGERGTWVHVCWGAAIAIPLVAELVGYFAPSLRYFIGGGALVLVVVTVKLKHSYLLVEPGDPDENEYGPPPPG